MSKKKLFSVPEEEYKSRYADYRTHKEEEQKPENAKKTFLRFLSLIKPHMLPMLVVVVSACMSTACNVISPEPMGNIISILQEQINGRLTGGMIDFSATYSELFKLAGLYAAGSIFTFIFLLFSLPLMTNVVVFLYPFFFFLTLRMNTGSDM